jgi:hypothetical protein
VLSAICKAVTHGLRRCRDRSQKDGGRRPSQTGLPAAPVGTWATATASSRATTTPRPGTAPLDGGEGGEQLLARPGALQPRHFGPQHVQVGRQRLDPLQDRLAAAGPGTGGAAPAVMVPGARPLAFAKRLPTRLADAPVGGGVPGGVGTEILAYVRVHDAGTWAAGAGGARANCS